MLPNSVVRDVVLSTTSPTLWNWSKSTNPKVTIKICRNVYFTSEFFNSSSHAFMFLNSFVWSRLCYACQNWNLTQSQYDRLDVAYRVFLRRIVRGSFRFQDERNGNYRYVISNLRLHEICGTSDLSSFIKSQQRNYAMHVIRRMYLIRREGLLTLVLVFSLGKVSSYIVEII